MILPWFQTSLSTLTQPVVRLDKLSGKARMAAEGLKTANIAHQEACSTKNAASTMSNLIGRLVFVHVTLDLPCPENHMKATVDVLGKIYSGVKNLHGSPGSLKPEPTYQSTTINLK